MDFTKFPWDKQQLLVEIRYVHNRGDTQQPGGSALASCSKMHDIHTVCGHNGFCTETPSGVRTQDP